MPSIAPYHVRALTLGKGHWWFLPGGGREFCPVMAGPPDLPGGPSRVPGWGGAPLVQGDHSLSGEGLGQSGAVAGGLADAGKLPKPEELVGSAYGFAEQLLASQRKFAEDVFQVTAPLTAVPAKKASSPKK